MDTKPLQQCDSCGAINTTKDQTWIRIPMVVLGEKALPIKVFPPRKLDFCPTCAPKTTLDKLPGLLSPTKK